MRDDRRDHRRCRAAAAGVSTSTVSRALSGQGYVARSAADRVAAAAKKIGCSRRERSHPSDGSRRDVGVLTSDLTNPFYAELATGIESTLREAGRHMLLVNDGGDPAAELAAVETFAALRLPGVIIPVSDLMVDRQVRHRIHVVRAHRVVNTQRADAMVGANDVGGRMATEHLIERGHHRIALLFDEAAWTTGASRLADAEPPTRQPTCRWTRTW